MNAPTFSPAAHPQLTLAFLAGALVATLAGLIGLGGAEFRLPLLIGLFGFVALEAVVLNKAVSLIVVAAALFFRSRTVPIGEVISHASIIVTLLCGSLLGAWLGADLATRLSHRALYGVIALLLLGIALLLLVAHEPNTAGKPLLVGSAPLPEWHPVSSSGSSRPFSASPAGNF